MEREPTLFVGVDWASKEHQVCLIGAGEPQQRAFAHDADGLGAMVAWVKVKLHHHRHHGDCKKK